MFSGPKHGIFSIPTKNWAHLTFPKASDFNFHQPTSKDYSWWSSTARDDPMFVLARKLGLEVKYYDAPMAPWSSLGREILNYQIFLCGIIAWLWLNRASNGLQRQFVGASAILTMIGWPFFYGQTGLGSLDFGIPAYAFLATLHFIDIFFTRDGEDTADWSYHKMYTEALTFPAEHQSKYPRLANLRVLGICMLKFIGTNIILYGVPPPHILPEIKNPLAWIAYHYAVGGCILLTLGWMIEGQLRIFGTILGVEQNPLFHNPMGSPNLRLFWGRWNLVIKDGLHRAIFKPKKRSKSRAAIPAGKNGARPAPNAVAKKRFQHKDQLSETEMSTHEDDNPKKQLQQQQQKQVPPRKRGSFVKKAFAALATFAVSGAFHEYMNHLAFNGATGENMAFFVTHASLVIAYVWMQRNTPSILNGVPNWLGVVLVNIITFLTSPLFCAPFVRAGFFEQLKNGGIFGPVRGFIYLYGR